MKWFILFIMALVILPLSLAQITTFVQDDADVLSPEEESTIESILQSWYAQDIAQVAVVTIPSLEGGSIEEMAFSMADGVLGSKDKDNGLLILIAVEDQKYRFEVGKGLEPIFNDAKVGRYGREFFASTFQEQRYADGIILTLNEMNLVLTGKNLETVLPPTPIPQVDYKAKILSYIISLFVLFTILSMFARRNARRGDDRYFWGALLASQMLRGPPGQGGFGGGGFGGFGGGGFGGGGASGGW